MKHQSVEMGGSAAWRGGSKSLAFFRGGGACFLRQDKKLGSRG